MAISQGWIVIGFMHMRIHFVIHESFEAPGAFEMWASNRGHSVGYSRVYAQGALPSSVDDIDLLIVMGGPQSPSTTTAECPHFNAAAEKALIAKAIFAGKAVVGVCLGSQLIGEALGAPYEHSPNKEIGKFPITLTNEGLGSDKFAHFGRSLDVGHWHNDMPGLTPDATLIADSEGCPRQIVEYGKLVYGFQCHMEFDRDVIELLIAHSEGELATLIDHKYVQQPDALRRNDYSQMNEALFVFLDKLTHEYEEQRRGAYAESVARV
jgi:GMP synthase (glutamine-hydrolysing)